jgi:hypothetical protein
MLLSRSYRLLCHPAAKLMANFFVRDAIYVERAQDSFKSLQHVDLGNIKELRINF